MTTGAIGRQMCEGELESLKAIYAVSPSFVPKPYAWGKCKKDPDTYFLLAEFRDVCQQVCWSQFCLIWDKCIKYLCPLCVIQQSMFA